MNKLFLYPSTLNHNFDIQLPALSLSLSLFLSLTHSLSLCQYYKKFLRTPTPTLTLRSVACSLSLTVPSTLSLTLSSLPLEFVMSLILTISLTVSVSIYHYLTQLLYTLAQLARQLSGLQRPAPCVLAADSCSHVWASGCSGTCARSRALFCSARICATPRSSHTQHTPPPSSTETPTAALPASKCRDTLASSPVAHRGSF